MTRPPSTKKSSGAVLSQEKTPHVRQFFWQERIQKEKVMQL